MNEMQKNIRRDFSDLLKGINIPQYDDPETQKEKYDRLSSFICKNIPHSLYRYRKPEEYNIEAFKNDHIPVTKPSGMGDVFDSQIVIDCEHVKTSINKELNALDLKVASDNICAGVPVPNDVLKRFNPSIQARVSTDIKYLKGNADIQSGLEKSRKHLDGFLSEILREPKNIPINVLRDIRHMACFCEEVNNIKMWDLYASGYTGYALEYNFKDCEMQCLYKCAHCKNLHLRHIMLPVIYNESYDATQFAIYQLQNDMLVNFTGSFSNLQFFDWLFYIKGYVYKSERYEEEKEWRLLSTISKCCDHSLNTEPYDKIHVPPIAIYFGSKIDKSLFDELNQIAVKKGLKRYHMKEDVISRTVNPIPLD